MQNAKIAAGSEGLDREVGRVSFVDCPINEDTIEKHILLEGDFYISSFFFVKDDYVSMLEIIKYFIKSKSSGLCIINEFIDMLPLQIIEFADIHNYPIIFIDKDIAYADVISEIMELLMQNKEDKIMEMKIDKLLSCNNEVDIINEALSINKSMKKYLVGLCYSSNHNSLSRMNVIKDEINAIKEWTALRYKENLLAILSFDKENVIEIELKHLINKIKNNDKDFIIGISNTYANISSTPKCIMEAITSCDSYNILKKNVIRYNELGVYKLLIPLKSTPEIIDFYKSVALPILEYDKKYNSNLFDTAVNFVENDGDYDETAKAMFLHKNTIRYRINKIMEILNVDKLRFYEELSIAIKIYKIMKSTDNSPL